MYSKYPFPISMENLPRHRQAFCMSLKFGTVITAIITILYTILGLAGSGAEIGKLLDKTAENYGHDVFNYLLVVADLVNNTVTLFLSVFMLIGAFKESLRFIRPWLIWSSIQLTLQMLLFIFFITVATVSHYYQASLVVYFVGLIILIVRFYMLVIVSSFYRQLEEEKDEEEKLKKLVDKETWYSSV